MIHFKKHYGHRIKTVNMQNTDSEILNMDDYITTAGFMLCERGLFILHNHNYSVSAFVKQDKF